jgi:glucokinase
MAKVCIGIDFGGTFLKFTTLDEAYRPGEVSQLPTPLKDGPEAILDQMIRGAEQLIQQEGLSRDDIVGVGIGSPGPLSISRGMLLALPNIPGMENFPMRDRVSERLQLPATLENDANAAAYAEFLCGAGKGTHDMVMLTFGTGVGSGIIINGRIIHGRHDIGAELGHIIVQPSGRQCSCGQKGCLEEYCSAMKLAKHTTARLGEKGCASSLVEVLKRNGSIDAKDINEARLAGDALAAEVWDECAYYLAVGCVNICRVCDPDRIVLAGGLTNAGDDLLQPVRRHWEALDWKLFDVKTSLAIATMGSDAGAVGAAGVAWLAFGPKREKQENES